MKPAFLALQPVVYGDTWDGLDFGPLLIDGAAPAEALASVRLSFRLPGRTTSAMDLTSAAGQIVIADAATWEGTVTAVSRFTLEEATYDWTLEFTDAAGTRKSYAEGTLQVLKDATR